MQQKSCCQALLDCSGSLLGSWHSVHDDVKLPLFRNESMSMSNLPLTHGIGTVDISDTIVLCSILLTLFVLPAF